MKPLPTSIMLVTCIGPDMQLSSVMNLHVCVCHPLYGASVAHRLLCQGYKASVKRGVRVCHLLYGAAVAQSAFVAHRSRRTLWKALVQAFAGLVDFNGMF